MNANNQIRNTGFSYDAAGNMTADGAYSYAYNAENQVTSAGGVNYTGACPERSRRDGEGLRVQKSSGTLYWRSYTGQVLEETDASGNLQRDYVFFGGRRIAWADSSGSVHYRFADALGSTRVVTDSSGNPCFEADYYPYGQENDYTTTCSPTYKFTGYEFDVETGNYYAYARYYNGRIGRFLTADPLKGGAPGLGGIAPDTAPRPRATSTAGVFPFAAAPLSAGFPGRSQSGGTGCISCGCTAGALASSGVSEPQSLNRYTYVRNNPGTLKDPTGLGGDVFCAEWAVRVLRSCLGWQFLLNPIPEMCVFGCAFSGPAFGECLTGCITATLPAEAVIVSGCIVAAAAAYLGCRRTDP